MDATKRIVRVIERLEGHFHKVSVGAAPTANSMAMVAGASDFVPDQLRHFFEICDGISVAVADNVRGTLFSISQSLDRLAKPHDIDPESLGISEDEAEQLRIKLAPDFEVSKRLYPIRGDGCGNFDCILIGSGPGTGAAVFWETTRSFRPAYLLAGDLCSYLEHWSDNLIAQFFPDGTEDVRYVGPELDRAPRIGEPELSHPWPFDTTWLRKSDDGVAVLLDNLDFRRNILAPED